jgi:hypothetical protein
LLQFSEPIWLYAIAAIAAPVIIHLWNNRHGKKLKIGSILFLEESSVQRTKRNFLSEWLLLILRCLLLILLALLLSRPFLKLHISQIDQKGWLLIDPKDADETYSHFKSTIDSLLQKGYELHEFNNNFKKISLDNISKKETEAGDSTPSQYRLLFKMLDKSAPASLPIYIFSTNNLISFSGEIPFTSRNLKWFTYTKNDSACSWINDAYFTPADSVNIIKAISKPSGTKFIPEEIANVPGEKADYNVSLANSRIAISIKNQQAVTVDTSTLWITIYADNFMNDAYYLKAAIESIQQFTKRRIRLYITDNLSAFPRKQDWLFWLSDKKILTSISYQNLFEYNSGSAVSVNTWLNLINENLDEKIPFNKYVHTQEEINSSEPIWKDGFGNPLLLAEKLNNKTIYHFYSHFDPAWNNLVWSNSFPSLLMNLFFYKEIVYENDKRIIDAQQIQPKYIEATNKNATKYYSEYKNLDEWLWFFVLLIFLAERLISFKTKKVKVYG